MWCGFIELGLGRKDGGSGDSVHVGSLRSPRVSGGSAPECIVLNSRKLWSRSAEMGSWLGGGSSDRRVVEGVSGGIRSWRL